MELAGLLLRVVVSLSIVLGLLWFAAKGLRKTQRRTRGGVDVDVLARQPLAQRASLAVVRLGDRALVLGVTESRIDLLHETALADVLVPWTEPEDITGPGPVEDGARQARVRVPAPRGAAVSSATFDSTERGALAGSALNPQTWTRAVQVLRERTVRR